MGAKLVVGPEDLQFTHDVGCIFYVSAYTIICQQKSHVVFYFLFGNCMFSGNDFHLSDIILFPRGAYVSVETAKITSDFSERISKKTLRPSEGHETKRLI